jgi:hypothetical protein
MQGQGQGNNNRPVSIVDNRIQNITYSAPKYIRLQLYYHDSPRRRDIIHDSRLDAPQPAVSPK